MAKNLNCRYACVKDINRVYQILQSNKYLLSPFIYSKIILKKLIKKRRILVIENNKVRGFVYYRLRRDKTGIIYDIAVDRSQQGKGLGEKLIDELKCWSWLYGMKSIRLKCSKRNKSALSFYKKMGFRCIKIEKRWNKLKKRNSIYKILELKI